MPTTLREYQRRGVEFLADKPFALLRMDRGTGKTPTIVVDIDNQLKRKRATKVLYIAPLSTLDQVKRRAQEFGTVIQPVVIYGDKQQRARLIRGFGNLHIINFEAVRIMAAELTEAGYDMVVVDESYRIKDSATEVARVTKALGVKAKIRRELTGMLFGESIEDAWNQIDFLSRSIFPQGYYPFRARYCEIKKEEIELVKMKVDPQTGKKVPEFRMVGNPAQTGPAPMIPDPYGSDLMVPDPNWGQKREIIKVKRIVQRVVGVKNLAEFTAKIAPYVYNVEKKEALPELPPKTYQVLKVKMLEEQAKLYARVMRETRSEVQGRTVDHKWALSKIQKLHQICSGFVYDIDKEPLYLPSAKFDELTTTLDTSLKDHDKAVIFTAFKAEPFLVGQAVKQMRRPIEVFILPEKPADRQDAIDRWEKWTNCPAVFIANIASGGVGLNLQEAPNAHFFSRDYKIEGREQAVDRVHRFGSEKHSSINIIDYIVEGTVDEDILEALMTKRSVVDVFMEHLRRETE